MGGGVSASQFSPIIPIIPAFPDKDTGSAVGIPAGPALEDSPRAGLADPAGLTGAGSAPACGPQLGVVVVVGEQGAGQPLVVAPSPTPLGTSASGLGTHDNLLCPISPMAVAPILFVFWNHQGWG